MSTSLVDQTRRILVIDDNEAIHGDFQKVFAAGRPPADLAGEESALFGDTRSDASQINFEVDSALQGREGYEKVLAATAAGAPYHLAFVDMRMPPGWDGVQTIQKLWEADPRLQVVICSAYSAYSWAQIAGKLGTTDRLLILKKPFDKLEVFQLATALTAKWLATAQAQLKLSELEGLVEKRTSELKEAAFVDRLTGLPNRALLIDRLGQLFEHAKRDNSRKFAVLFLDFDRFKVVNDSLGHEIGDLLLIAIANRLLQETRRTDLVASLTTTARLGGDEFIVVLDELRDHHDAVRVTERLLAALAAPFDIKGNVIHSTASIGVTTNAAHYTHAENMIRDADTAMYRAKAAGKACYMVFDRQMHQDAVARLTLESDLRQAIETQQFMLHYQPIVSLSTGAIVGFEALVRWRHPERGLVSPAEFIPLAEEIGVIVPLGYWVLAEACRQLAEWRKRSPEFQKLNMSVNLSRKQLAAPDLVNSIRTIIEASGVHPSLKLEITESAIMNDAEASVCVMDQIRALGVELHMDDFGTGYSSLSCLHRFPIGGLKIDRSFVSNMGDRRDYVLVLEAIISLAQKLNLRIVAEGVETEEQMVMLQSMGCDLAQGYYFARPLDPGGVEAIVTSQRKLPLTTKSQSAAA